MENSGRSVLEGFEHIISNTLLGEKAKQKLLANKIEPTRLVYCGQLYIMDTANNTSTEKVSATIEGLRPLEQSFCLSFTLSNTPNDGEEPCPDCEEIHETGEETIEVSSVIACRPKDAAIALSELMRKEPMVFRIVKSALKYYDESDNPEYQLRSLLNKILSK